MNALARSPLPPFRRTAGFSATAQLQRADFGISAWPNMIGAQVELRIEVEAVYAPEAGFTDAAAFPDRGPAPAPAAPPPPEHPTAPEPEP